uniref:Uncharacterized protein n=1 Tax=Rhizophora mucronata TaxID=61149 RepID=A0A2P2IWY0_RHIMU
MSTLFRVLILLIIPWTLQNFQYISFCVSFCIGILFIYFIIQIVPF